MNITMEEFKKKVVPYLEKSGVIIEEAEKIGVSPAKLIECYWESNRYPIRDLINDHYVRAQDSPNEGGVNTICEALTYQLDLNYRDEDTEDIKKMLNLDT